MALQALLTCADLIRGNGTLQERLAQRDVAFFIPTPQTPSTPLGDKPNGQPKGPTSINVNVIQGLLDLALAVSCPQDFDVRLAACECIKAYFYGHGPIRLHFLRHARNGHLSNKNEPDNIFTILLEEPETRRSIDPYRQWIAAVLLFHLIQDDYDAKKVAMDIAEGDAEKGEEVVTCIQGISANLILKAEKGGDERVVVAYLMVLSGWLYEDFDAVNDFLQEGSNVQGLIQVVMQPGKPKVLEAGLCAFLLGIVYEFSTKDSPIPRSTLHEILTTRMGREQFNSKLTRLREHSFIRDFEVLPQGSSSDGLPSVYFDRTFIDFLKDNFSRVYRAIDRDPGMEVSVVANGVQQGVSRELVDSLKAQLDDKAQSLQKVESEKLTLERKLGQEQAEVRKARDSAAVELARIKNINESLQWNHEEEMNKQREEHRVALNNTAQHIDTMRKAHDDELQKVRADNTRSITEATSQVQKAVTNMQTEARRTKEENEAVAARVRARHEAEVDDLKAQLQKRERELEKATRDHAQDLRTANEEYESNRSALEGRAKRAAEKAEEAEARIKDARKAADEKVKARQKEIQGLEEAKQAAETERDDLLLVLADLEEKRSRDKVCLSRASYHSHTTGD